MYINLLMRVLQYDLERRGIKEPLSQYVRICDLWAELARLQQEPLPRDVVDACNAPPFKGIEVER